VDETPVFIHPVNEDPAEHLEYDVRTGLLIGRTERGQKCIDLLGLNRDGLVELRRRQYVATLAHVRMVQNAVGTGEADLAADLLDHAQGCKDGTRPFSLAGRVALREEKARLRRLSDAL
jgi:hypothetical protein